MSRKWQKLLKLVAIGLIVLLPIVLFPQLHLLLRIYWALGTTWKLILNFLAISSIAFIFASLLAPLEALGWWAGWYGEEVNTHLDPGKLVKDLPANTKATRYVIYLDGIAQSKFEYLQDAETFLQELESILPDDILIIKGLMPYSPMNLPLTENRVLSFFWRIADYFQVSRSGSIIGLLIGFTIQLRNLISVAISADQRYGPIYNQGTAQVMYNSLINYGYRSGSNVPITLIGYSGGAQISLAAAPYLKKALNAPIDVISISGVFSGNNNILKLEHFYHFVGDKDLLERLGPIVFPRRWKIVPLSYWNRAKRYGKVTITSLGPVGHNDAGGPFSRIKVLRDGRTFFQQTVDYVAEIISGDSPLAQTSLPRQMSNYELYQQASFNQPNYYPLNQPVNRKIYRPIAVWMGRLILPRHEQRRHLKGVLFEVHHADDAYQHLIGKIVNLRWKIDDPRVQAYLRLVTKDLYFSTDAKYSQRQGYIHPERLNHWRRVDPLESLAGSRPYDDVIVMLPDPEVVEQGSGGAIEQGRISLFISREPVQITGRFYGLVKILQPVKNYGNTSDYFQVVHFNRASRQFDGIEEVVRIPNVIPDLNGVFPSTNQDIEKSPLNSTGWYIYGAPNNSGVFVVQSIAPRALLRLQPDEVIFGKSATWNYLKKESWEVKGEKGRIKSVLLCPHVAKELLSGGAIEQGSGASRGVEGVSRVKGSRGSLASKNHLSRNCLEGQKSISSPTSPTSPTPSTSLTSPLPYTPHPTPHPESPIQDAIAQWKEGDRALVLHTYGGIGGKKREPAANTPIFFGHFAYGVAQVVREPLADEMIFDIKYYQVYTHNVDGIIAGTLAWNRFIGDRQFGWLGTRPVCDILIKLDAFTGEYDLKGLKHSPLDVLVNQLESMTARYRIGDGSGGTYVGAAHNCAQDSNQALYTAIKYIQDAINSYPELVDWLEQDPEQGERFRQLVKLGKAIKGELLPFGTARADWQENQNTLGISPEEQFFQTLLIGLGSWRTLLPRLAAETVAKQFLNQRASIWVLRTNQVGGYDADIEPIAPTPIGW